VYVLWCGISVGQVSPCNLCSSSMSLVMWSVTVIFEAVCWQGRTPLGALHNGGMLAVPKPEEREMLLEKKESARIAKQSNQELPHAAISCRQSSTSKSKSFIRPLLCLSPTSR
jgi:hypothetical protein